MRGATEKKRVNRNSVLIPTAVFVFSLLAGMPAAAQEALQNADFSSGLAGWKLWIPLVVGGGTVDYSTSAEGGGAGRITAFGPNTGSTAEGWLSQCVTVVPGNWYWAFAQARTVSASGNAHFFLYVVWSPGSVCGGVLPGPNRGILYAQAEFSQSTAWTNASVNSTVPPEAGSATFQLAAWVNGAGTADALFDNASFVSAGPNSAPVARFTFSPVSPKALETVQFTDTSPGAPTAWSWDFSDGGTSTAQNPMYTFSPGTYEVSLTVSNAGGANTKAQTVVVSTDGATVCTADGYTACLIGGRYKVTSHWQDQYDRTQDGPLSATRLTDTTAAFWHFDASKFEYFIRINTATDNGKAWIAIPSFTNVEFWVEVTDTTSGQYKEYHLPQSTDLPRLIYDPYFFVFP